MSFNPLQAQKFKLSGNGVGSSDTSIVLQTFDFPDGTNITTADFGSIAYMTLEPGTSREEQISFTGVTQNADNTATLTGVTRGLSFDESKTETSALKQAHAGGTIAVLSNTSAFYSELAIKQNDETVSGAWTFSTFPQKSGSTTPTSAAELATKAYVDATATGSALYDQNITAAVAGETVAAGELVRLSDADGEWYLADASSASTSEGAKLGIAQGAGTDGNAISGGVLIGGVDKNATYTAGQKYYVSDTAGALATSAGTVEVYVGKGDANNNLVWEHVSTLETLTADEKDGLTNTTSGTPLSSTNGVVDEADVSDSGASGKIVRATVSGELPASLKSGVVTLVAGENISADDAVAIGDGLDEQLTSLAGSGQSYEITATRWMSQSITTDADTEKITEVSIRFNSSGATGTANITVGIYTDSSGSPGTLVSSETFSSLSISGSTSTYTLTFTTPIAVTESTTYHVVIYRPGGTTDCYLQGSNSSGQGAGLSTNSGSSWSASNGPLYLIVKHLDHVPGYVYRSNATSNNFRANAFIGFAESAITAAASGSVFVGKVASFLSGLTSGALYYLSDSSGAISTSAGSQSRVAGRALSATELLITHKDTQ